MLALTIFLYAMAAIGIVVTGFTLVAYWMIYIAATKPSKGTGE